jgi:protoporphyrinogen oxidase
MALLWPSSLSPAVETVSMTNWPLAGVEYRVADSFSTRRSGCVGMTAVDVLILGGGPTGLGCAWRLSEHGDTNWLLCEQSDVVGGLSRSVVDDAGFTWDLGGHVVYGQQQDFLSVLALSMGPHALTHFEREASVLSESAWVPYPFQNNIRRLPSPLRERCQEGLLVAERRCAKEPRRKPSTFMEFIEETFGAGISDAFMRPYNEKLWAQPLESMSCDWVDGFVSPPAITRGHKGEKQSYEARSWGPNSRFSYPRGGGIGSIWHAIALRAMTGRIVLNARAIRVDLSRQLVEFEDGRIVRYGHLVSTIPVPVLAQMADDADLTRSTSALLHSSVYIVGLGVREDVGRRLGSLCWAYFPDPVLPFYRLSNLSYYNRDLVPANVSASSLMVEVSDSRHRSTNSKTLECDVIHGLVRAGILHSSREVLHTWIHREEYAYPTPTLHRDKVLRNVQTRLEGRGVLSRGRFGAWRYECSNMEQSFLQGCEAARTLQDSGL